MLKLNISNHRECVIRTSESLRRSRQYTQNVQVFPSIISNSNDAHNNILARVGAKGTYERILKKIILLHAQNIVDGILDTGTHAET